MDGNSSYTEKDLDQILDNAFRNSNAFTQWFLSKTRFSKLTARYKWSRSDHPWGQVPLKVVNPETGKEEIIVRECETDILVIFESDEGLTFALHIENKLANGKYTQYQPDLYSERAKLWMNDEKYGNYSDFETVLVAPIEFYTRTFEASQPFDKFVSYEEVALLLPEFSTYLEGAANNK